MAGFPQMIKTRVADVERHLHEAAGSGDDYLLEIRLGELESLVRVAADHGLAIDEAAAIFARYGRNAPDLGMTGPIDMTDLAAG